ncbi:glycosyltransferase family 4 protein [Inconstantimicrobium porci]|uniref:Glycosyltransferase family 4 protein n=1 Tax=Inconstantimicrobium porci TaxID=2652291 RepID=A0A7X2MY50_9CLOT|nr:glycosyltransferase family 4 protein [Inconstantimicrobium porci]MSR91195.1 glycosyltransferase family 4 protein [Inconstantimicrobium porci]
MINILYLNVGAELYGADVILLEILKNIDKSKFKPYVILPNDGPLVKELEKQNIEVKIIRYPILRRKYFNIKGIIEYTSQFLKSSKILLKFCVDNNIDLIHSNTSAVLEGAYIYKKLRIKHIWHVHEMISKPKIFCKVMNVLLFRRCDEILTVSNAVKTHLLKGTKNDPSKIKVIHNGIDLKVFSKQNDTNYLKKEFNIKNECIIGFVGRINAIKGQEEFVMAAENVFKNTKNTKAIIVGSAFEGQEWRVEELLKKINNSRYKDRFIFTGYRNDAPNIQNLIDVFVLPSIEYDSFPTVVLEAMACSKPVVAYRCGGVVEMINNGKSGFVVEQNDLKSLSECIEKLVNDEELRKKMGNRGRRIMQEKFSVNGYISRIEKLYLNIM